MLYVLERASREALPAALAEELRQLGRRYGIHNIRVFGSFARGEAGPRSDLDLLVDYVPGQKGFAFVHFCEEAEARRTVMEVPTELVPAVRELIDKHRG